MGCFSKRAGVGLAVVAGMAGLVLAGAGVAEAHSYKLGHIEIGHLWSPPPKEGIDGVAVYGPILNEGTKAHRLEGATSPIAAKVRFRQVKDGEESWPKSIELAPNKPVSLAPWRTHIWLSGLKKPLKAGDWINLTLDFGDAGTLKVKALVETSASD